MRKFLSSSSGVSFHVLSPLIRDGYKAGIIEVDVPKAQPLLRCISKEVCNAALLLVNKNLMDMVVIMVKHNHIKQNWDKLKGKVILDCHNICPIEENMYHI